MSFKATGQRVEFKLCAKEGQRSCADKVGSARARRTSCESGRPRVCCPSLTEAEHTSRQAREVGGVVASGAAFQTRFPVPDSSITARSLSLMSRAIESRTGPQNRRADFESGSGPSINLRQLPKILIDVSHSGCATPREAHSRAESTEHHDPSTGNCSLPYRLPRGV